MSNNTRALLFDLDGTLLDTGRDMGRALNRLLEHRGQPEIPYSKIRPRVSQGTPALLKLGFGIDSEDPEFDSFRAEFLALYAEGLCVHTELFSGMEDVLSHLESRLIPWGIVTNKPEYLALPLLEAMGLRSRSACIVGGDTLAQRKPHPAPLLHGCSLVQTEPASCIYVGDAPGDIEAGRRAGMRTLIATFGYLDDEDDPDSWGADGSIDHPGEILQWL